LGRRARAARPGDARRTKFLIQTVLALIVSIGLYYFIDPPQMYLPGYRFEVKLEYWYFPVAVLLIVGFSNAMNLTDGLDGLAGLIAATAFVAVGVIALLQRQIFLALFALPW
jgi:phospho-N-acetylmuramoyl-pentapeptide-transferase